MIYKGKKYRIISDQVGTPKMVVDVLTGHVVARYDYDEFGNMFSNKNLGHRKLLPFGFAGGLSDSDTGLIRMGARDYDPEIGRWTTKDPILFNGGDTNLYGYVVNDPVNFVDPSGKLFVILAPWTAYELGYLIGAILNNLFANIPFSQTYGTGYSPLLNLVDSFLPSSGSFLDPDFLKFIMNLLEKKNEPVCE